MSASFVHLHLHSEYSLIDSTIRIAELVEATADAGMPAVALTDEANLFALVKFYKAAEGAGLKPIVGADLWVADPAGDPFRATLLCADRAGYGNLSALLSRGYRERSDPERVVVRRDWLEAGAEGLIVLLGPQSDLAASVRNGHDEAALAGLRRWQRRFGDRVYLELLRTQRSGEDAWLAAALDLGATTDCPAVATNDVLFLAREDFEAHEARVCIHGGHVLDDPRRPRTYGEQQYLKTPGEVAALFGDLPEALENAVELAKRCNLELSFGRYHLPAFPVPDLAESEPDYLRRRAREGLVRRLDRPGPAPGHPRSAYEERLSLELDVIVKMGFPGYFLIVADFIGWAKENGIPVGPGRGSGAGSLVAWALAITDLDPLRYELLFERFLNPERVSMPDFDIDFCMDRRDEVIDYVGRRYGREKVSQIITYGTMAAKAVLRDTGRVLGMGYGHVDRIAKTIPPRPLDITLDDALGVSDKAAKEPERISAEFKAAYEAEDEVRTLVDLARKLEDLTRNAGKHAGGVVIAPSALTDFAPLYCEARSESVVTQFDKDDVEAVGLVKFDFLGLRTLTIIDWAVKAINRQRAAGGEAPIDIALLPTDDPKTYRLLASGETTAVFQLESRGMKELARKLKPGLFDEIIALGALYRPGPLQSGMVDEFVERKHGRRPVTYPHPLLEPILKPTYGVIVYQEQVMQIAQVLAGYSLGGADLLRRAMGKKKAEEMAKERAKFEFGAAERGVPGQVASSIFDLMEKFAEYGFNKSHSAAYAVVTYQTAWLKAHYPAPFMAAVLSSDMDHTDKVVNLLDDARAMKLDVSRPDVNEGTWMFEALQARTIRYGLGAIKGVGRGAVEALVAERERGGRFASLLDLCQRVDPTRINKRVLEALILSGAADGLAANRATLMAQLPEVMKAADQRLKEREAGQVSLFGFDPAPAPGATGALDLPEVDEWPLVQRLNGERETLGHYLSGHPTDAHRAMLEQMITVPIGRLEEIHRPPAHPGERRRHEQAVAIAGLVVQLRRRGDALAFAQLEDASGRIEVSFFREAFHECAPLLTRDAILVVEGGLSLDEFSGNLVVRARRAWTLDEACERFGRQVRVRLDGVGPDFARALSAQVRPFVPGPASVRLHYCNADAIAEIELGEAWRVRATPALVDALRRLPGVRQVDLALARAASGS
ncbi:MAG: DNA polymerase III subunit alpha [Pseudomonadota bacterium]